MEKLNKKGFEILYLISRGRNTPERINELISHSDKIIKRLENLGLLKISIREDKIYAFMETDKGENLLNSKEYTKWFIELGD